MPAGSALGVAMGLLADAVDALAAVDLAGEHVGVVADALVGLAHLQAR